MKTNLILAWILLLGLSNSGYSIDPKKEYALHPAMWELSYEEFKIVTPDQFEINTWIINPFGDQNKNKTVVIANTDAGNMGNMLGYALYLAKEGYRVVTFDYRGFGDSTDFDYSRNNLYHKEYVTDFVSVMNWCKNEYSSDKIGVLAYSMGTLITAIGFNYSPFDFYIGEGFVLSPLDVKNRILKHKNKEVILPKSARKDRKAVKQLDTSILLFAAENDVITTEEDAILFCASRKKANVISYAGDHLKGVATLGMKEYINEIISFLDSN
ncbi:MAG: alpha/beta fold hydrolase [Bacteroidota bacterium]